MLMYIYILWSIVSNSFLRSMNTSRVDNSLSRDDDFFNVMSTKAVAVDLFCLKTYWLSLMSLFFSRKLYNVLSYHFSNISVNCDYDEIG